MIPNGQEKRVFGNLKQNFFLVSSDSRLQELFLKLWPKEVQWVIFEKGREAIEKIFNDPPDLLLVDSILPDIKGIELISLVKTENVYRQVPVILCLGKDIPERLFVMERIETDDFLVRPIKEKEAKARLVLTWQRASRSLDANPLTKLPGNTSIIQHIQELIDQHKDFALAYLDLDHFKAFNDKYGFSRGDEVLMMTSRIIVNTVRAIAGREGFVGHIGGDDFVFTMDFGKAENACKSIIDNFDSIVPHFYDQEDRERGLILSKDRQGRTCTFPLMAISIAVVSNEHGKLTHYGQASQIASNLKKIAKANPKSCYVLDRRKTS